MLTNIYDVLRSPKTALERINDEANIYKALNFQGIVLFINALTNKYDAASEDPLWLTLLTAVIAVPVALAVTYLVAGLTHGIAHLMGGQGTWKKLFITLSYCMIPQMIFIPIEVVILLFDMEIAVGIAALVVTVWSIVLGVLAVIKTEKLSTVKSCIVLFAPTIIAFAVGMIFVFAVMGMTR